MLDTAQEALDHFFRSLVYRFNHVTENAPEGFGDFEAGAGVRTPGRIVRHLSSLLTFVLGQLKGVERSSLEPLEWEAERARFLHLAGEVDKRLDETSTVRGGVALEQLWRGPLTDAMTHVGQLALLRRLAGSPIESVRYWEVEMPPLRGR